jgi:hypothetical protein
MKRKFTDKEFKQIRAMISLGYKTSVIIEKYETKDRAITRQDIFFIKTNKHYKDVV